MKPATIVEPPCAFARPGAIRIGILRTARLYALLLVCVMAMENLSLRWDPLTEPVALPYLLVFPLVVVLFVALPRSVELRADSIITSRYGEKTEHSVTEETKPILLVRPLSRGLHHMALVRPTGSGTLFRIVPIFDCVIRDSDVPTLRAWADHVRGEESPSEGSAV